MALLAGMSLGIPAVASDFGGNPHVISDGENGLIFPKKDSAALAKAILKLKEDRQLYEKMSKRAREIYSERFTLDAMGEATYALYEQLLG
jgi:glycosyltransferase involved in cell wall biosynthesis